jgi:hypothetical protein
MNDHINEMPETTNEMLETFNIFNMTPSNEASKHNVAIMPLDDMIEKLCFNSLQQFSIVTRNIEELRQVYTSCYGIYNFTDEYAYIILDMMSQYHLHVVHKGRVNEHKNK